MAFKDFPAQEQGVRLLQRSLERGRLAHAYLFIGHQLDQMEAISRTLAKTLNCLQPIKSDGVNIDCCDKCLSCRKIDHNTHPDVHWVRPESKSRVIIIDQMRELIQAINLKPGEAEYKVATIVAADRLNVNAANAFLKTLEEPPSKSILVLLTTEPQRVLETILSRCLRLNLGGEGPQQVDPDQLAWLTSFSEIAAVPPKSLLGRYRLMDVLLKKLNQLRESIDERLTALSPLEQHDEIEKDLADKWQAELKAAVEAEYRRQRSELLLLVQWWLRDIWIQTLNPAGPPADRDRSLLCFPQVSATRKVAARISPEAAMENLRILEELHRWLGTNVQEALALEVSMLKLSL